MATKADASDEGTRGLAADDGRPRLADRVALTIVYIVAAVAGVLTLVFGGWQVVQMLVASPLAITLPTNSQWGFASGPPIAVTSGTWSEVQLLATGYSPLTVGLLAAGVAFAAVTAASVCAGIVMLSLALRRGDPFRRSLTVAAIATGAVLSVGSLLAQGLHGLGTMQASSEMNEAFSTNQYVVGMSLDPVPWGVGLVIIALGYVFQRGARLQRDTEGLV